MKNIAIAKDGNIVSEHFGHCEGFEVFQLGDGKIENRFFIENPGHRPGFLPVFLSEKGVHVVISGGMGATAQALFGENNIEVVVGAQGSLDAVIEDYVAGTLKSSNSICEEHMHAGHCND
ncbi:Predicted Fe-Mo cluster-binding protein, NifX family [Geosporobacter subterraneus DSM 17957]|uniref:Predicted Fe-Mo cluster-binding protein, NifX family n=1 Tax=Geosporobacter subterraneus DSM 17957 TaxID=1121919 RepID=A0A1M6D1H4_9FIRM|nr:NifB/NifX family molybdenum-iron cluster-binding protein [Geosporobacter subterraneus]SHI67107.1 Predicted Fe-Mo cluster-binding protein, NifX family [Geosporobacter subterraneus DSM 17957]